MRFFDASTTADLQVTARVLADLDEQATRSGVHIMVVGAVARDILISQVTGAPPQRATADLDIAVAISSWSDIDRMTAGLSAVPSSAHRFIVRDTEVDIIPFGDIETAGRTITWPNDHRMNVLGFREAYEASVDVKLPGGLVMAVASLPAQSLLKLFAWRDRRYETKRDAIDLKTILYAYQEGRYLDELYEDHGELLEKRDFDPAAAGAKRLGREADALLGKQHRSAVTDLLDDDNLLDALTGDMGVALSLNRALLVAYRDGFGHS